MPQSLSMHEVWNSIQPLLLPTQVKNAPMSNDNDDPTKFGPLFVNWSFANPNEGLNVDKRSCAAEPTLNVDELIESVKKVIGNLHLCAKYTECFMESNLVDVGFCSASGGSASTITPTKWKNPKLYKTTLCDYWNSKKRCKYGNKCWFAHGLHELRYVSPHELFGSNNMTSSNSSSLC